MDKKTGLVSEGKMNQLITHETRRPDGSLRIQTDYSFCPSMAEQHTGHLTDLNYLIERYKPDELAAYLAARTQYRQEIVGHDFSVEPDRQEANNVIYTLKKRFEALPEDIKNQFKNHVEFLKFIDNPANQEKIIKMGLMTRREILQHTDPIPQNDESNDESSSPSVSTHSKKTSSDPKKTS